MWRAIYERVVRELIEGMGDTERLKKIPSLKRGVNHLSPFIGRELAILLWALMEDNDNTHTEAILHGWRELAREERWWFYAKAVAPGQRIGIGWRRALFHALSETPDSRAAEPATTEKKSPGNGLLATEKSIGQEEKSKKAAVAEADRQYKDTISISDEETEGKKSSNEEKESDDSKSGSQKGKKNKSKSSGPKQLKLF